MKQCTYCGKEQPDEATLCPFDEQPLVAKVPPQIPPIESSTRPTAISVICIIAFIGGLIAVPLIFSNIAHKIGAWYPPYLGFSTVFGFICFVGLWKMRRWALFAYTAFCIINQIVLLAMGFWSIFALIIPGLVIAIGFKYLSKMS